MSYKPKFVKKQIDGNQMSCCSQSALNYTLQKYKENTNKNRKIQRINFLMQCLLNVDYCQSNHKV